MDTTILKIIERKKQGIDCTEEESANIKGWLTEKFTDLESKNLPVIRDIQEHFPLEYGEWSEEHEKTF